MSLSEQAELLLKVCSFADRFYFAKDSLQNFYRFMQGQEF